MKDINEFENKLENTVGKIEDNLVDKIDMQIDNATKLTIEGIDKISHTMEQHLVDVIDKALDKTVIGALFKGVVNKAIHFGMSHIDVALDDAAMKIDIKLKENIKTELPNLKEEMDHFFHETIKVKVNEFMDNISNKFYDLETSILEHLHLKGSSHVNTTSDVIEHQKIEMNFIGDNPSLDNIL